MYDYPNRLFWNPFFVARQSERLESKAWVPKYPTEAEACAELAQDEACKASGPGRLTCIVDAKAGDNLILD